MKIKFYKYFFCVFLMFGFMISYAANLATNSIIKITQNGTADEFLRSIYANYYENGPGVHISDPKTDILLSPTLLQLVHHDNELMQGEAGFLDADPICDCQDHDDIEITAITLKKINTSLSLAKVKFKNLGHPTIIEFSLLKRNGLWYIDDIHTLSDNMRLRTGLEHEIRDLSLKSKNL